MGNQLKNDNYFQLLENPNIFQTIILCQIMLKLTSQNHRNGSTDAEITCGSDIYKGTRVSIDLFSSRNHQHHPPLNNRGMKVHYFCMSATETSVSTLVMVDFCN